MRIGRKPDIVRRKDPPQEPHRWSHLFRMWLKRRRKKDEQQKRPLFDVTDKVTLSSKEKKDK